MTIAIHTLQSAGDIDQAIAAWKARKNVQVRIVEELEEHGLEGFVLQKALDTVNLISKFIEDLEAIRSTLTEKEVKYGK